jgi:hypothetical protein
MSRQSNGSNYSAEQFVSVKRRMPLQNIILLLHLDGLFK